MDALVFHIKEGLRFLNFLPCSLFVLVSTKVTHFTREHMKLLIASFPFKPDFVKNQSQTQFSQGNICSHELPKSTSHFSDAVNLYLGYACPYFLIPKCTLVKAVLVFKRWPESPGDRRLLLRVKPLLR